MVIYFNSFNALKHEDVKLFFKDSKSPPRPLKRQVPEVLSFDLKEVVRTKAREAYRVEMAPLFVEHGGLFIDYLNKMPGPLVKPFWEQLGGRLCDLLPPEPAARRAHVVQMVCYCDGKTLETFQGRIEGHIAPSARGSRGIHWEPIFIPDGQGKTLGEMEPEEKLRHSASAKAYRKLRDFLKL